MIVVCALTNGQEIIGETVSETDTHINLKQCFSYVTWVPRDVATELIIQGRSTHEASRVMLTPVSVLAGGPVDLPLLKTGVLYKYPPCEEARAAYMERIEPAISSAYVKA